MDNYALYYLPKSSKDEVNDILTIFFGGNVPVTNRFDDGDVSILYYKDEPAGYLIKNFSKICKIKINGMIYLPNSFLLKVINSVLLNHKLEGLSEKNNSGFIVGKIVNKIMNNKTFIYKIDIGQETLQSESTFDLNVNALVIVALTGTYLLPGRMIGEYEIRNFGKMNARICTYEDLQMESFDIYQPLIIEENLDLGSDFFLTEVKANA